MKVLVYITPKSDILDPQGKVVGSALQELGYDEVEEVRIGRYITLEVSPKAGYDVNERLDEMSRRLLANINVESYKIELAES